MKSKACLPLRLLPVILVFVVSTLVSARAQSTIDAAHAGCGSLAAATIDLQESIRRTAAEYPLQTEQGGHREKTFRSSAGDYIQRNFWVFSFATGSSRQVTASLLYEGIRVRIWVDDVDTASIPRERIDAIARALDTATPAGSRDPARGIVENNEQVFGSPPSDFALDGGTDFLITDIITGPVNYVGFFSRSDQMPVTQNPYSNEMNLLYIDSREVLGNMISLLGIIAHEHQHLIHYGQNPNSRPFFNEGCSELASIINGYHFRGNYGFMANTNIDLLRWISGDDPVLVNADYERAMTLHLYLYEQFGERFITELVRSGGSGGTARINITLERTGHSLSQMNWTTLVRSFTVANWLRQHTDPRYGYRFSPAPNESPAAEKRFEGSIQGAQGSMNLQRAASMYHVYDNPGALLVSATGTRQFRVMAMIYRGSEVEVQEFTGTPETLLGRQGAPPEKIVLAFVNLSEDANEIIWNTNSVTLGGLDHTLPDLPTSMDLR